MQSKIKELPSGLRGTVLGASLGSGDCISNPCSTRAILGKFPPLRDLQEPTGCGRADLRTSLHRRAQARPAAHPAALDSAGRPTAGARGAGPANQRSRGGRGGGAARAERTAKQRRQCRPGADHATLTRALPAAAGAAAAASRGPRAPQHRRTKPGVRSVPARALSRARALPGAWHRGARRVRLLRALPGRRGRELRGPGRRALRPRARVCEPRRGGRARGHRALRVRAARLGLRLRRPVVPQRLRAAPARPPGAPRAPWPPAQGARRPLRIW